MMPEISVILPVRNEVDVVGRAIESLLSQTMPDFELLISDDGSTDGSLDVCKRYAQQDERIRLLSHAAVGVSYARNAVLERARAPYVAFVDADDMAHADMLESLLDLIDGHDLAFCGYEVVDEQGIPQYDTTSCRMRSGKNEVESGRFLVDLFSNRLMYQGYVWNKLFRASLLGGRRKVRFRRGISYNEDRLFVLEYLERCKSVGFSMKPCYTYVSHPAPKTYSASRATELVAFDEMHDELLRLARTGHDVEEAIYFEEKDEFRACVELLRAAYDSGDPDALWLSDRVSDLSLYAGEFKKYPKAFRNDIKWALSLANAVSA
jgi:glycosyltransferase involved in cell wall biosynthesis